jgi:hypothetical protein
MGNTLNPMGNEQFNSYRSGRENSRSLDYSGEFSPSRNANTRGELNDDSYGNSEYFSNRGRGSNQGRKDWSSDVGYGSDWASNSGSGIRSQSNFGNNSYDRNRNSDRDWSDRTGDEVRSWFGDDEAQRRREMDERRDKRNDNRNSWFDRDNRDNDDWGSTSRYSASSRDNYDNSRTIGSGRYRSSDDNYTGYGRNTDSDRSGYSNVYGSSYGRGGYAQDQDRYGSNRYGSSNRYEGNRSWNRDYDDDRGFFDRAGDEVRSWFGDEEAERRRRMDDLRNYNEDRDSNWDRNDNRRGSATYTSGPPYSYGSASRRDYEW